MKVSSLLFSLLLLLLYQPLHAQDQEISEEEWREWTRGAQLVKTTGPNEQIEGTPYFNSDWSEGRVLLRSDRKTDKVQIRYNANTNELEFKKGDEILVAIPRMVKAFWLQNEDREQVYFRSGFKSEKHKIYPGQFLRVIHDGDIKLIAEHRSEFVKAHSVNPLTGNKTSKYIPKKNYFLITEDGTFKNIKLKRKHILRALGNHKGSVRDYVKSNDLDFGEEEDIDKILTHYESLGASD